MADPSRWTRLHARVHQTLRTRKLLEKQQRLLVAVSGGQDSLCLMKLLLDLQKQWHWDLAIAHCDHGWRSDSAANARHVEQLAQTWQVPFYQQTTPQIPPSEAAARQWRYQVLSAIAQAQNYSCIITGHTASDRAETLLYNLMRGSGADGLQALTWKRELLPGLTLVRPLLEVTRAETALFCQQQQLPVWEDSTNQDTRYARNRIRHELIPYLQTHFNPQTEQTLAQTAELLQAEVEYLEAAADQLFQQAQVGVEASLKVLPEFSGKINRSILRAAPLALQRRVMRRVLQQVLPHSPSFEHIEKLTALITAANRSRTDPFPGGAIAQVEGDWIWISTCP